ncbi:hypothetical protein O6H91_08G018500 [Diphasiastrum complanatum]|uniref:Uncharacterized protein n=1 Tax=Diphasiastrum complanatum TaxID=34168 RepID=A0ACC2CVE4_DIPCM|nr:hypothetical protein O6H91_08G018500 [Diphasiastrum complanatum]
MAELRKNPISGRWVIFSTHRGKRPSDFRNHEQHKEAGAAEATPGGAVCAFCAGHESEGGGNVLVLGGSSDQQTASNWLVRVAMNIFPAVSSDPKYWSRGKSREGPPYEGCFLKGLGSHEVVIETPDHNVSFVDLPVSHVEEVLKAFQARVLYFRKEKVLKYCQIFKNQGGPAGASMSHSHSQIIALPIIPKDIQDEIHCAKTYFKQHQRCLLCDIISKELEYNVRVIGAFTRFVVLSPYAAAFPYESWIVPLKHSSNFEGMDDQEVQNLAEILKSTLTKLNALFNFPPYNYTIQTSPLQEPWNAPYFHWYIRIIPHLTILAGFELATDCHINPVFPEEVAKLLQVRRI